MCAIVFLRGMDTIVYVLKESVKKYSNNCQARKKCTFKIVQTLSIWLK